MIFLFSSIDDFIISAPVISISVTFLKSRIIHFEESFIEDIDVLRLSAVPKNIAPSN